jgi:hypothetical protein
MARKQEGDIKYPKKSHLTLSPEEAKRRALERQRDRRAREKLGKALDPAIKIKEEGAVQISRWSE